MNLNGRRSTQSDNGLKTRAIEWKRAILSGDIPTRAFHTVSLLCGAKESAKRT
jgi:hypothetical protein